MRCCYRKTINFGEAFVQTRITVQIWCADFVCSANLEPLGHSLLQVCMRMYIKVKLVKFLRNVFCSAWLYMNEAILRPSQNKDLSQVCICAGCILLRILWLYGITLHPWHQHTIPVLSSAPPQTKFRLVSDRHSESSPQRMFLSLFFSVFHFLNLCLTLPLLHSLSITTCLWVYFSLPCLCLSHAHLPVRPGWHQHVRAADAEEFRPDLPHTTNPAVPTMPSFCPQVLQVARPQFSLHCAVGLWWGCT